MKQSDASSNIDWLENFPKQYRESIATYEQEVQKMATTHNKSDRYIKLYESNRKEDGFESVSHSVHLQKANQQYASHQTIDRRVRIDPNFLEQNSKHNRRKTHNKPLQSLSSFRDSFTDDAIEKRKRLFQHQSQTPPKEILGLDYHVLIADNFMFIGCIERTIQEWQEITDREILAMDGKAGLKFWQKNKTQLLNACKEHMDNLNKR